MMEYNKLLDFIPYFENENIEYCNWVSGYPQYDDKFDKFIKSAYQTEILKSDYLEYLDEKGVNDNLTTAIPTADLELLKAIFTYYIRQERFCDGAWASAIKEKVFLSILYRLRNILI